MRNAQLKTGYLILEGLNSFATVYYFYYLYFFMQQKFGFDNQANLGLAALSGLIYMCAVWWAGKFAQRFGYFTALKLGFPLMAAALGLGAQLHSAGGQILVMAGTILGMSFTWPTLEALVSEGETPAGLQRMVGIYNVVWAATAALAYFTGGALLDALGLNSLFYVPMAMLMGQLGLTFWLEGRAGPRAMGWEPRVGEERGVAGNQGNALIKNGLLSPALSSSGGEGEEAFGSGEGRGSTATAQVSTRPSARAFVRMAWLANPFAYVAINTLIAVMPGLARRLDLSTMLAGFCGSVWCFARLGAFFALWFWNGWHYRFGWLLAAYLGLAGAFLVILTAPSLAVLVVAQVVLGGAVGLLYYSSLFYSMDNSQTKSEHGGVHEAAIGLGNFAGPAIGAASLHFLPDHPNSDALAVSALLMLGLGGLLAIWWRGEGKGD